MDTTSPIQAGWATAPRSAAWYAEEARREARVMTSGVPVGLPMGFTTLDRIVRLRGGQLIVLAARSSMGKTSFALQVAMNNALALHEMDEAASVVMFSAEMSGAELFQKMASIRSGANLQEGYGGSWDNQTAGNFYDALNELADIPLIVNDLNQIKTAHMRDNLQMLIDAGRPPKLVVFDYIELGADDDKYRENERIAQIVFRLKQIARDLNIPVLALSQINREIEKESRHRLPMMHNLAGSDSVGRTADKVITMLIPNYYLRNDISCACEHLADSTRTAYLSIQKDRFGARGLTFRMGFHPFTASFFDLPATDPRSRTVNKLTPRSGEEAKRYWQQLRDQQAAGNTVAFLPPPAPAPMLQPTQMAAD